MVGSAWGLFVLQCPTHGWVTDIITRFKIPKARKRHRAAGCSCWLETYEVRRVA